MRPIKEFNLAHNLDDPSAYFQQETHILAHFWLLKLASG